MTEIPMAPKPKTPDDATTEGFGPLGAKPRPKQETGKYDVPSQPHDDFAIDEQRIRRLKTKARD